VRAWAWLAAETDDLREKIRCLEAILKLEPELEWAQEDYQSLQTRVSPDPELLIGLDESELRALAEGMLSPSHQERLRDLLQRNRTGQLSKDEESELDRLLAHVDSMNILKARALRTLQRLGETERD
jgi:hypothetical protein